MVYIPTIDFSDYDEADSQAMRMLADSVAGALTNSGFLKIRHLGISQAEIDQAFEMSRWFFEHDEAFKEKSAYVSAAENFGFQSLGVEHLDPTQPADLKQTFTMRDLMRHDEADPRWPSEAFRDFTSSFYQACLQGAYRIMRVFSLALEQPSDFFVRHHNGENVTLRYLYYPSTGVSDVEAGQLGAGAHTDYGMITLLFQKDVGGLEVQDATGDWHEVEPENDAIVINTGDLMERWTNGKYRSTPHRVQPKLGDRDRYSIAMFVDPDAATPVSVLESCLAPGESKRYADISAGEHIQERISASHGN